MSSHQPDAVVTSGPTDALEILRKMAADHGFARLIESDPELVLGRLGVGPDQLAHVVTVIAAVRQTEGGG